MTTIAAIILTFLSVTAGVSGCHKGANSKENKPQAIRLDRAEVLLTAGESVQIKASVLPAVAVQPAFQWISSDNAVATVNGGIITGVMPGKTKITVSTQGVSKDIPVDVVAPSDDEHNAQLFSAKPGPEINTEFQLNGVASFVAEGLKVSGKGALVKLNRFYAVAERKVVYKMRFSPDARVVFQSSEGDFSAFVDLPQKKISLATTPVTSVEVPFLQGETDYIVEVFHIYQLAKLRITDPNTGQVGEVSAVHDGQGGVGEGALQPGFPVGMQWDYYCFGLQSGNSVLVKEVQVFALKKKVKVLMYGDSITQPEGYYPSRDFPEAWTQRMISRLNGNAMSSGRGGGTIDMVMNYIKNELPFIDAEYVMVTIGTNGGNTEKKLTELVEYIRSQGAIPILNNIPSNESGTQVKENMLIGQVRTKLNIKGCRFDLATSINGDGKEVDKTTMYWEDYSGSYGWQIYHHPNEKGGRKMFEQSLIDIPEIYQ